MAVNQQTPRVAIVTGAAGGIGRATTLQLLEKGWSVCAVDRAVVANVPGIDKNRLYAIECDLTGSDVPRDVVAETVRQLGSVDLLVNNAGISGAKSVDETDDDNLSSIMEVNFTVPFRLSRESLKVMRKGASIVHVSSVVNFRATPSTSAYTASKAALAGLTRQMAAEYGPRGIRCNAVAPGLVETALTAGKLRSDQKFRRIWIDGTPWHRLGRPEDVASAIVFLASPEAEFVNGHTLVVDGGWSVGAPAV